MNTKTKTSTVRTFASEDAAMMRMRIANRVYQAAGNRRDLCVVVEGPGDGEWSTMDVREAIEGGFAYVWEV